MPSRRTHSTGTASCTRNAIRGGREQGMEWTLVVELEMEWSRRTAIHATSHRTLAGCILHSFSSRRPAPLPPFPFPASLSTNLLSPSPTPLFALSLSIITTPQTPALLPPSTPHESNVPSSRIPQRHVCIGMPPPPPPHPHCPLLSSSSSAAAPAA